MLDSGVSFLIAEVRVPSVDSPPGQEQLLGVMKAWRIDEHTLDTMAFEYRIWSGSGR